MSEYFPVETKNGWAVYVPEDSDAERIDLVVKESDGTKTIVIGNTMTGKHYEVRKTEEEPP